MRATILITSLLLLVCCRSLPDTNVDSSLPQKDLLPTVPEFRIETLSKENRKDFEQSLPSKERRIFDEAIELKIVTNEGAFTIADSTEKSRLLDSIYWDLANSFPHPKEDFSIACQETTPSLSTSYIDENLLTWTYTISLSYTCSWIVFRHGTKSNSHHLHVRDTLSKPVFDWLAKKHKSFNASR